ncbi:MAG: type II secretion system F family protein [Lachnospiraceae bacterium]
MFTKKTEEKEPQYYKSATNIDTLNYRVYYMSKTEIITAFVIAFAVGAAVGYLFYGGLFKDEFGDPTTETYISNLIICTVVGLISARVYLPMKNKSLLKKRNMELSRQFKDMLDGLTASLNAGNNVNDAFVAAYYDLKVQYDEGAYILKELEVLIAGINNNVAIEDVLADFGERSNNDDIRSFANVFRISYRKGGNIKDIIRNTQNILSDKMNIHEDIETIAASNNMEQYIMIVMPILIVGMIKLSSPDFAANFATSTGIVSTTIGVIIYVIAYKIGKSILEIKI